MRVARFPSASPPIFPLDDVTSSLLFGGVPLRGLQEIEAARAGCRITDVGAAEPLPADVVAAVADDVVFSSETLTALLQERERGELVAAAVQRTTPLWRASAALADVQDDLPLQLFAGPCAGLMPAQLFSRARVAVVCDEASADETRVAPAGDGVLRLPAVQRLGGRPRHWLHVLDLSLAALSLVRRVRGAVAGNNRIGADVSIHPTAWIVDSVIEDGARIEPHASVVGSYVGRDVHVADHSVIVNSVLGAHCRTLVDTHLRRVVAMPEGTLSNLDMQDALFGTRVFVTTAVAFFHPGPGKNVLVDGKDSGRAVLGGAIGARCVLGSRALFAAGTALPPGLLVVARPQEGVARLDVEGLGRAAMIFGDRNRDV